MKNLSKAFITSIFLFAGLNVILAQKEIKISSPDKHLSVLVFISAEGRLSYSIKSDKTQVLQASQLGITVDSTDLGSSAKIASKPVVREIDESFSILGNHQVARNHANEANIPVEASGKRFKLIVRVYDDGVAVRYTIPEGSRHINSESTSWNLPENTTKVAWQGFNQSYEALSYATVLENVPQDKPVMGPLTVEAGGLYLSISEADCENFSDLSFIRTGTIFKAVFPFAKQGWDIQRRTDDKPSFLNGTYLGQNVSPWRTTII